MVVSPNPRSVERAYAGESEFATSTSTSAFGRLGRLGGRESAVGVVVGAALLAVAALSTVAAVVGFFEDGVGLGPDDGRFAALAAVWGGAGVVLLRVFRTPTRPRSASAFVTMLVVWVVCIGVSTVTYLVVDTFDHVDDALFESVSGFTTTATTVVADPEALSQATLAWRAGTQWLGGLGALLFVVAVLPSIGVGGLDVTDSGRRYTATSLRSRRTVTQLRRLAGLYALFTGFGVVLFLVMGMDPFDAVTYAATTISTGGFANHLGSFGHFESTLIEWAGVGGMVLGGMNMALVFRVLRTRDVTRFLSSFELRAYLTAIVVGSAVIVATTMPDGEFTHDAVRHGVFHVASATSTTGHFVGAGWGPWDIGPQVLLLAIMGVGSMSGSSGGGFRQVRALALVGYLRRELVLQVTPRAVAPVRVGRRVVSDELVGRMIGYQAQYLLAGMTGATILAVFGADLVTAMTASISALANVGPALGELVPGAGGVLQLPRPARAAMLPLMLLGRLEIAPVLVASSAMWTALRLQRGRRRTDG